MGVKQISPSTLPGARTPIGAFSTTKFNSKPSSKLEVEEERDFFTLRNSDNLVPKNKDEQVFPLRSF